MKNEIQPKNSQLKIVKQSPTKTEDFKIRLNVLDIRLRNGNLDALSATERKLYDYLSYKYYKPGEIKFDHVSPNRPELKLNEAPVPKGSLNIILEKEINMNQMPFLLKLFKRELEALEKITEGHTYSTLGIKLGCSYDVAKKYVESLCHYAKIKEEGLSNQIKALKIYIVDQGIMVSDIQKAIVNSSLNEDFTSRYRSWDAAQHEQWSSSEPYANTMSL